MMKKTFLILVFMLLSILGFGQTESVRGNLYELKGKVISEVSRPFFMCGRAAWATVVEYEIIEFSNSSYQRDSICVIFTCPSQFDEAVFRMGKVNMLKIADQNQADFHWNILDKSLLDKYHLDKDFYVIEIK